jgi:DNA-binding Xre family transcriptional regulator
MGNLLLNPQRQQYFHQNTVNQLCKLLECDVSDIIEYIDEDNMLEIK